MSSRLDPKFKIGELASDVPRTRLSVSVVTFYPDLVVLEETLRSLSAALLQVNGLVTTLWVIDNSSSTDVETKLSSCFDRAMSQSMIQYELITSGINLGYGRANNLVLPSIDSDYHLILNPDVILDPSAIQEAIAFLELNSDVGLLAPASVTSFGQREHLCKGYPTLAALFLRGFTPGWVHRQFQRYLANYERHDLESKQVAKDIVLASGCFMFIRSNLFRELGGFSPRFFMYFEDYDLSMRVREHAYIAYVSAVKIAHRGGRTSGKGFSHILMFCQSAYRFFSIHGWKVW